MAGLGNIYVCEALHRAHLSPKRIASTLALQIRRAARSARDALADAIKAVLNDAIKAGGSSLRDHRQTDGDLGYFQHSFRVYDRAGDQVPDAEMQGHDQADRAGDAVDVLLSGVSEVTHACSEKCAAGLRSGRKKGPHAFRLFRRYEQEVHDLASGTVTSGVVPGRIPRPASARRPTERSTHRIAPRSGP